MVFKNILLDMFNVKKKKKTKVGILVGIIYDVKNLSVIFKSHK
jgi:glucose uptake protein GlcU